MTTNISSKKSSKIFLCVLAVFGLAGFAIHNLNAAREPQATVSLAYLFPEGKTLTYQVTSSQAQNLDVMGQAISTASRSAIEFTVQPKSVKEGQHQLGVTVHSFKVEAQTPQGDITADTSSVVGKSFEMILSRLGKEIDVSGASAVQYTMGQAGTRDLGFNFQALFPDLPEASIKIGDTWPSEDMITQKIESGDIRLNFKNMNAPEAFETFEGFECLRIKSTVKGTMTGNLEQQGMSLLFDATINGTQTWYFAVKQGILVKEESNLTFAGTISAGEPANITIPAAGNMKSETRLIKK